MALLSTPSSLASALTLMPFFSAKSVSNKEPSIAHDQPRASPTTNRPGQGLDLRQVVPLHRFPQSPSCFHHCRATDPCRARPAPREKVPLRSRPPLPCAYRSPAPLPPSPPSRRGACSSSRPQQN